MEKSLIGICHFEVFMQQVQSNIPVHGMGFHLLTNTETDKMNILSNE